MPFNVRSTALSAAVLAFFVIALVGAVCTQCPFTCCKRALFGAVITYIVVSLSVRAVNAIAVWAMATKLVDQISGKLKHRDGR